MPAIQGGSVLAGGAIQIIEETVLKSAFTDGNSTSGTYQLAQEIPIGAFVIGAKIRAVVAFSGDTSAVLTIGDGSDVDRYNTGTPDVFSTAANGIAAGIPSGIRYHATAVRPTLTVTSAADFTNVAATGSVTIQIYYV